jgi:hypothetical protein
VVMGAQPGMLQPSLEQHFHHMPLQLNVLVGQTCMIQFSVASWLCSSISWNSHLRIMANRGGDFELFCSSSLFKAGPLPGNMATTQAKLHAVLPYRHVVRLFLEVCVGNHT